MQEAQIVCRSRSCRVKSALQNPQACSPAVRAAPHAEQRTTDASWPRNFGTCTSDPQAQWNRLPAASPFTSYWRVHDSQAVR